MRSSMDPRQHGASRIESAYIRNKPKHDDFATASKQMSLLPIWLGLSYLG